MPTKAQLNRWPQDRVIRRGTPSRLVTDPLLKKVDKEHYGYTARFDVTAAGANFSESFAVVDSNYFYIANFNETGFAPLTQTGASFRPGFVTLRDNSSKYLILDNVPLAMFNGGSARQIFPIPYGIAAGGSFSLIYTVPPTASLADLTVFISIEGYKDFSNV